MVPDAYVQITHLEVSWEFIDRKLRMKFTICLIVILFAVESFTNKFPSQVKLNHDIIFSLW